MSYAGPVSRAKRASAAAPSRPAESRKMGSKSGPPARPSASYSDDHRPMLVFAAGIVLGMTVGAGVALMFAPQTGADTRRTLRRKSRRAARRGQDAWDDLRDELRRAVRRRRLAFARRHQEADELDEPPLAG